MNTLFVFLCFVTLVYGDGSGDGSGVFDFSCPTNVMRLSSTTVGVIWMRDPEQMEEEYNSTYMVSYGTAIDQLDNHINYSSPGEQRLTEHKLRIAELNPSTRYYFQVHVTQPSMTQPSVCSSTELQPISESFAESLPEPPSTFSASPIGSKNATFSWNPISDTILSCYPNNSNVLVYVEDFGSSTRSAATSAVFQPYTEYICDASTKCAGDDNCAGRSISSHFRTYEAVSCVTRLSIQAERTTGGRSMNISWSACQASGRIVSYVVTYEPLYNLSTECQRVSMKISAQSSSTNINNLDPLLTYKVYVSAYNSAGDGANSNSTIVPPSVYDRRLDENRTLFIQLRFISVESCMKINHTGAIESALAYRLSLLCSDNCADSTEEWLTNSTLLCTANRNQVLFLAQLCAHMRTEICYQILEHWTLLPNPFLLVGDHILLLDSTCPLYTNSLNSNHCSEFENASITSAAESNGPVIAGAFFGGFLSCCLILAFFVIFVAIFSRSSLAGRLRQKMKGKGTEEIFSAIKFSTTYAKPKDDKSQQEEGEYEPLACYYSENEGTSKTSMQTSKQTKASKRPHINAGRKIPPEPKQNGPKSTGTSNLCSSSDGEYATICSHSLQNPQKVSTKSADAEGQYEYPDPQKVSTKSADAKVSTKSADAEGQYEILDPQSTNGEQQYENLKAAASSSKMPVTKQLPTSGIQKAVASASKMPVTKQLPTSGNQKSFSSKMPVTKQLPTSGIQKAVASASKMPVTKQLPTSGNQKAVASASKMPVTKQLPTSGNQKAVASASKMPVTKQLPTSGNQKAVASSSKMPVTKQLPTSGNQKAVASASKMPVTKQLLTSGIQKLQLHKEAAGSAVDLKLITYAFHEESAKMELPTGTTERKKKKPVLPPSAATATKARAQKAAHTGQDKAEAKAPPPGVKPKPKKENIPIVENPAYRCPADYIW